MAWSLAQRVLDGYADTIEEAWGDFPEPDHGYSFYTSGSMGQTIRHEGIFFDAQERAAITARAEAILKEEEARHVQRP